VTRQSKLHNTGAGFGISEENKYVYNEDDDDENDQGSGCESYKSSENEFERKMEDDEEGS